MDTADPAGHRELPLANTAPGARPLQSRQQRFATEFLANLDFDLSAHAPALAQCDLGTARDVYPLRNWATMDLLFTLAEAMPQLLYIERYELSRRIKTMSANGGVVKSPMRVRVIFTVQGRCGLRECRCNWTRCQRSDEALYGDSSRGCQ